CSGSDATRVDQGPDLSANGAEENNAPAESTPPDTNPTVNSSGTLKFLDRLSFGSEKVGFWALSEDAVLLEFDGAPGEPEIQELLDQESDWPVTAAELWLT